MHVLQVWYYIKAFLPRFIDDEDEDLVESFKNNDFVLTGQVVCDICDSWLWQCDIDIEMEGCC